MISMIQLIVGGGSRGGSGGGGGGRGVGGEGSVVLLGEGLELLRDLRVAAPVGGVENGVHDHPARPSHLQWVRRRPLQQGSEGVVASGGGEGDGGGLSLEGPRVAVEVGEVAAHLHVERVVATVTPGCWVSE